MNCMKRNLHAGIFSALVASIMLSSCSRENSVVSNHSIQKRKYTSGYHIHFKGLKKSQNEKIEADENVLASAKVEEQSAKVNLAENENYQVINQSNADVVFATESNSKLSADEKALRKNESRNKKAIVDNSEVSLAVNKINKRELKSSVHAIKNLSKKNYSAENNSSSIDPIIYIILCILLPFIAVGLATNWDVLKTVLAVLLTLLFWIPGIIYAFIICSQEGVL